MKERAGIRVSGLSGVRAPVLSLLHPAVAAAGLPAEVCLTPAVEPWKYAASEHNERMHRENTGSAAAMTLQMAALRC
jgi:hypothetical protein